MSNPTSSQNLSFEKYTSSLSFTISLCENTLRLLENINTGKTELPSVGTTKEKILQILVEYIILKIHCLFDRASDSISFEKIEKEFGKEMGDEKTKAFRTEYLTIKKKHGNLIERFENNRHKGIAHTPKKEDLGWNEETLNKAKEIWGDTLKNTNSVADNYVFLVASNFPIKETFNLLKELQSLIFYKLWYQSIHNS